MDKSLRIKANVGSDQAIHINMKENVNMYEILSLTLAQEDAYKIHSSNYGVVIGRVLANDAFGVPNAKVSIFIPLTDEDSLDNSLSNIYPYSDVKDTNTDGIRYNLLPTESSDPCYAAVGTFPSKRMVLDNDTVLEVYDKYYKYSTVTNKSGDYMIFGVPTGTTKIHVDVDLSDIGILSQKPRDLVYRGYNINQFESPTQFKKSTSLDSLAQIYSQDDSITVYPFWGDSDATEAAISRKDISLQYEFNTTCVFLGCAVTDSKNNNITHTCDIGEMMGEMSQLTTGEGTIEMIRKTPYGNVEEYTIQGNDLIDSNGVWCYQIPMNLDYIGMDEYGNIVPTNDPTKGIPTRARVRFRITMNESGTDTLTRHKARYLVPNNPFTSGDTKTRQPTLYGDSSQYYDSFYTFGTNTPDICFRDLMWNCVYTVKSFIPRLQRGENNDNILYSGIKGVNKKDVGNKNPFPYNKIRSQIPLTTASLLKIVSDFESWNDTMKKMFWESIAKIAEDYNINNYVENILSENDSISLDFYNDWINGALYFPLWFWRVRMKKKYSKGETVYDSKFCQYDTNNIVNNFYNTSTCDLPYKIDTGDTNGHTLTMNLTEKECEINFDTTNFDMLGYFGLVNKNQYDGVTQRTSLLSGIIKQETNKDGANVYYYCNSQKRIDNHKAIIRLFSTDIVLLGSLVDTDLNGIPKISDIYPITTANIPPIGSYNIGTNNTESNSNNGDESITGMHWGLDNLGTPDNFGIKFRKGLFFGTYRNVLNRKDIFQTWTLPKTCINAERVCELGVSLDMSTSQGYNSTDTNKTLPSFGINDGLITKREIEDENSRQIFSSLNMNPLIVSSSRTNSVTSYYEYPLEYSCPIDFDGSMNPFVSKFTGDYTYDDESKDYNAFRFGKYQNYEFNCSNSDNFFFPAYHNSFYFYFGLNAGNTAIEVFKKNFYSECNTSLSAELNTFKVTIASKSATACNVSGGSITIVDNDNSAYYYEVLKNNNFIERGYKIFTDENETVISGLTNGIYTVNVDLFNETKVEKVSKTVKLSYTPINGTVNVTPVTVSGGTGSITITSILLYNSSFVIDNVSHQGNDFIITSSTSNVKVSLTNPNNDSFTATTANGNLIISGLSIGSYSLTLTEMCNGKETDNTRTMNTIYILNKIEENTSNSASTSDNS